MNITMLRLLRLGAGGWPPHQGDPAAQRRSIRNALATIRHARETEGGHVHIGLGGATVHYSRPGYGVRRLSGHSLTHCYTALGAMIAGVPWVDTRPVEDIAGLIGAPLIACGHPADPPPWRGFSHAPLDHVFAHHRRLGAHVGNWRMPDADGAP